MNSRLATKRFSSESAKVITKGALREIDFSTFDVMPGWEPREGCTYTVTRAISARINQNYDGWPSEELKKSYRTFLGKPVFVNHINDDPRKARGVVVASRYVEAGDDKYIEVIQEVDAVKFPKLAYELATGGLDGVSMGCEAGITKCSYCGNQATDMLNMCAHVIRNKGQVLGRVNPDGSREDVLVYEECRDIKFFELSYVFDPADETAVISNVITANNKKMSFGETSLPPQVDTLRDEDEDIEGYFIEPPEQFKEPDLDLDYPQTTNQGVAPMPTKNINSRSRRRNQSRRSNSMRPRNRRRVSGAPWDEGSEPQFQETPSGELVLQHGDYEATVFEDGEWTVMHQNRPVAEGHAGDQDDAIGSVEQWFKSSRRRNQSRRSKSMRPRARRNRFAEDRSRNDQGKQEDAFISQTPPEEPVETGDGASDAPNNSKSDRVKTDPNRSTHTNFESRRRVSSPPRPRGKNFDPNSPRFQQWFQNAYPYEDFDDYDEESKADFLEEFDNGSRTSRRRRAGQSINDDKFLDWYEENYPDTALEDWSEGELRSIFEDEFLYVTGSKKSRRRRAGQSDDFNLNSRADIARDVEDEEVLVSETGPATNPKDATRRKRVARGEWREEGGTHFLDTDRGTGAVYQRDDGQWDAYFDAPDFDEAILYEETTADDDPDWSKGFDTPEEGKAWAEGFDVDQFVKELESKFASKRRSSRRRKVAENFEVGDKVQWVMPDGSVKPGVGEITNVSSEGGQEFYELQWDTGETDEGTSRNLKHYEGSRKKSRRRRRMADSNLDLAAPDGRINVEAPTSGTTDEEAQASQYNKSDYGHNAGDDIADPDLTTDQNWAPGEGKKSSSFNKRASQIEAMRLAEAMVEAGLETHDDRWKLAETYTKLPAPIVRDRIALLSRVASVSTTRRSANVQRPLRSARRSPGLGQQPILEKSSSRVDDYTFFL